MRANWITSLVGGAIFGVAIAIASHAIGDGSQIPDGAFYVLALFFCGSVVVGVTGLPPFRELFGAQSRESFWELHRRYNTREVLVPIWGRMFLWFISTTGAVFLLKIWL